MTPAGTLPIPDWLNPKHRLYCGVSIDSDPEFTVSLSKGPNLIFRTNPGPQTWAAMCPFDEVLIGGRRGGGKSRCLQICFAMGDLRLPVGDPARDSFLNDPSFRGLILREEYQSMSEFVDEAIEFFKPLGCKATGNPVVIEFKTGAKIYFNHLGDANAFTKYRGWNLTKIGIEEAAEIKTLRQYLKLKGSLRSVERVRNGKKYPPLRTQMLLTSNPDGPGSQWLQDRFVFVRRKGGGTFEWNTPMLDTITGQRRIYIPFGLESNPYLGENTAAGKQYRANLMAQDETTRKQWLEGDWRAGRGLYFQDYRPEGPRGDEEKEKYPWARHVVKSAPLRPWWFRWCGADIGYDHPAAAHKFCRNEQDKRIHVYDEMQVRRIGSFEWGAMLAKWWLPELEKLPDHQITIYLSPDAFSKRDVSKTQAEQMEMGIKEVLGPYGALLLKYNEDEREAMMRNPKQAALMFERRRQAMEGHMYIALKPQYIDRVSAWGYCRDLLRFRPAVLALDKESAERHLRQVLEERGQEAYELEAAKVSKMEPEILPKIQIWDCCWNLDRCLKEAQHGEETPDGPSKAEDVKKMNAIEGEGGDDALEAWRNGCVAYKEIVTTVPKAYWVNERIAKFQENTVAAYGEEITDPTRLMQISMMQQALYDKENGSVGGAWTPPRQGSMRHRVQ